MYWLMCEEAHYMIISQAEKKFKFPRLKPEHLQFAWYKATVRILETTKGRRNREACSYASELAHACRRPVHETNLSLTTKTKWRNAWASPSLNEDAFVLPIFTNAAASCRGGFRTWAILRVSKRCSSDWRRRETRSLPPLLSSTMC